MAMRDPKLRRQLETHHRNAGKTAKLRQRDEVAARMSRALRDEDEPKIVFPALSAKTNALFSKALLASFDKNSSLKLFTTPRGGKITGKTANALIIDDIMDFRTNDHDDLVDATMYAMKFDFGAPLRPAMDVVKINCT